MAPNSLWDGGVGQHPSPAVRFLKVMFCESISLLPSMLAVTSYKLLTVFADPVPCGYNLS